MEDIAKLNHLLRVPNQQPAILRSSLEQLSQKLPSREILKSTKIGCFAVSSLLMTPRTTFAALNN